jgi:hypothetical protein
MVNAAAVLCEYDASAFVQAIAERLSSITPLPITDDRAVPPTQPLAKAHALADFVAAKAAGTTAVLGAAQVVADLGGGRAALRPAAHLLAGPNADILDTELVAEPSIANVYSGRYPTYYTAPGIPHDGFLANFLMRCKGFARD